MTQPRPVVAGRTYMVTRRCTQRMYLLRPDPVMNQSFAYCLAVAAQRYGIAVQDLQVQSNHYHMKICDERGNYPEFLRYFHSLVARCINALRGRWENLWASEQPSMLHLADADANLGKGTYLLTNAVKDHLVDKVANWPGLCSYRYQLADKPMVVRRPKHFFDPGGGLPETVTLRFIRPREFAHLSHEQWVALLRREVTKAERSAAQRRREKKISLLGRRAVRRQSPFARPKTVAKRRGMVPRVATRNKWLRIEQLTQGERFRVRYRRALLLARSGLSATFPYGTYKLRSVVTCEPAPDPTC